MLEQPLSHFDLYLDESGNTGGKLDDLEQPLFVYAGWLVRHSHVHEIESIISQAARSLPGNRTEIKGSRLLKSQAGKKAVEWLLNAFATRSGAIQPVFTVWEKRYAMAIEVFETLLNPNVVPDLPAQYERDREVRICIANAFYALSDERLTSAWRALRERDVNMVRKEVRTLTTEIVGAGKCNLAFHLSHVDSYIEDVLNLQIDVVDKDPNWKGLSGLHAQSLIGLLNDVERLGRCGVGVITIHADETREFRPVLEAALQRKQREPFDERSISEDLVIRSGYVSFRKINFVRSQDCIVIQAADILAALLAYQLRDPEKFANSTDDLAEMTRSLIDLSVHDNNAAKLVISKQFRNRLD